MPKLNFPKRTAKLPAAALAALGLLAGGLLAGGPAAARTEHRPPARRAAATGAGANWPTYLGSNARNSDDTAETAITTKNVATLKQAWTIRAGSPISASMEIVNGVGYWGSWDGYEHATNLETHKLLWQTNLGSETTPGCAPEHIGVASSAAVGTVTVNGQPTLMDFVGGGDGSYYGLNATTGAIVWEHNFGTPAAGWFAWSSPAIVGDNVYVGVASVGDCPLVQGQVVEFNAATGAVEVDTPMAPNGCAGGTVWGSPTIDPSTGDIYFATGNDSGACPSGPEPLAQAIVQFSPSLQPLSSWRIPQSQAIADSDFGTTPTLFTGTVDGVTQPMIGAANKNGIYYALLRNDIDQGPVWEEQLTPTDEDVAPSAWDGHTLYLAASQTVIRGHHCQGSIRAVTPGTGKAIWADCLRGGENYAPVTLTPGIVWGSIGSILYAIDAKTGTVLWQRQEASGALYYAPVTFWGDEVFVPSPDGTMRVFEPAPAKRTSKKHKR